MQTMYGIFIFNLNSIESASPMSRPQYSQRTGPIPKSEKNTWKKKTKYRWNLDEGLLATRTRKAATAKTLAKKKGGGGRDGGEGGFW